MTDTVRFIHCADLHLDSPFKGLTDLPNDLFKEVKNSTFTALNNLVETAMTKQVDFVLLVGDVFDQSVQSVYAQMQFLDACQRLKRENIAVYLSYGNHDYRQSKQKILDYPDNVHIFSEPTVTTKIFTKNNQDLVTIHGFSYPERAVTTNKTEEYQRQTATPYQIGMLHGSVAQQPDHDHYAPFHLGELIKKPFDYWALGHIHQREVLKEQPAIIYPGNIQGRSKKETGAKGCYYVELSQQQTVLIFCPLQSIIYETLTIDVANVTTLSNLQSKISDTIKQQLKSGKAIVTIRLTNYLSQLETWYYEDMLVDIIDFINEKNQLEVDWVWIQSVELARRQIASKEELREEDPFIDQLLESFQAEELEDTLAPLWSHRQARKYLEPLTEQERVELMEQAADLAVYQLVRKEK